jgi:hypothetical protein
VDLRVETADGETRQQSLVINTDVGNVTSARLTDAVVFGTRSGHVDDISEKLELFNGSSWCRVDEIHWVARQWSPPTALLAGIAVFALSVLLLDFVLLLNWVAADSPTPEPGGTPAAPDDGEALAADSTSQAPVQNTTDTPAHGLNKLEVGVAALHAFLLVFPSLWVLLSSRSNGGFGLDLKKPAPIAAGTFIGWFLILLANASRRAPRTRLTRAHIAALGCVFAFGGCVVFGVVAFAMGW